jgi:hypothetical protein
MTSRYPRLCAFWREGPAICRGNSRMFPPLSSDLTSASRPERVDSAAWAAGVALPSGHEVFAINPFAASRYCDCHVTSGAKADPGDAKILADVVWTDR